MNKTKKKQKNYSSDWKIVLILIGIVFLVLIFLKVDFSKFNTSEKNTYENYKESSVVNVNEDSTQTYCYNGKCYQTYEEYSYAKQLEEENRNFELVDSKWTQHVNILSNDAEKTDELVNLYCSNIDISEVPNCINIVYPRLETYAVHISNAQSFMLNEGNIFKNQQEFLAYLDEHVIYVRTNANNLDVIVNEYNSWVSGEQQSQQQAEILSNIIKILAMTI